jgi:tryptophan aminotransferase
LLEDDAYHYLSFDPDHLVPSYFELEAQDGGQQGRVLRFDSFSKILSSGSSALVFEAFLRTNEPNRY